MNDKYVKVIYQTPPIGEYGIVLEIQSIDLKAMQEDEEKKQLVETKHYERFNINPNEPLHILEQRINKRVDELYIKQIESLRKQLEWYIQNTAKPKIKFMSNKDLYRVDDWGI